MHSPTPEKNRFSSSSQSSANSTLLEVFVSIHGPPSRGMCRKPLGEAKELGTLRIAGSFPVDLSGQ
jgi:hypothetical protein